MNPNPPVNAVDMQTTLALQTALTTQVLGRPLRYLPSVTSTQDVARAAAEAGEPEGLAVVAGQQTAGRGRAGRSWWSPPTGGLYVSLLLRPQVAGEQIAWLTMCLALGAVAGVEQVCGLAPDIKWPNDLEVRGRKLAGILAEGAFDHGRLSFAVVGLGLNANVDFEGHPDLQASATSLRAELGRPVDLTALLAAVLAHTERHYLALRRGVSPLPAWRARLATLGQAVEARGSDGRLIAGQAVDVLSDGALCIQLADNRVEIVRATDVTLRR